MYEVKQSLIMDIDIKEQILNLNLLIVNNIPYDIILGADMLAKYKIEINYEQKVVKIGTTEIHFCDTEEKCGIKETNIMNMNLDISQRENNMFINKNMCKKESLHDFNASMCEEINKMVNKCPQAYQENVKNILYENRQLVSYENRIAENYVHKLEMKNIENFRAKSYPIPYKYQHKIREEISKMLESGIIERSRTQYINPVVIVPKSNGDMRICLDARIINQYTVPQFESPMTVNSILGNITEARYFSKIDLKNSFWLIPLDPNSRKYTGFQIDGVVYNFRVVPFGLQSAGASLNRALHVILDKYEKFVLHYIDDILIFSKNENQHLEHIKTVLEALNEAGLKLNPDKCEFFQNKIKFLGYQVTLDGITMDPDRIKIIQNYKRPNSLKTLRGFLGMINYFKRLIPDLARREIPLVELLRKHVRWKWTQEQESAFEDIKKVFCENIKVYHPNYQEQFILRTDASKHRLAGVLLQKYNGIEYPICFLSRITKPYEKNYGISELELASIIYCVEKMKFYLAGNHFKIQTDNSGLTSILKNKYGNSRIHRWGLLLQEYKFDIEHIKGKDNLVSDHLSRFDEPNQPRQKTIKIGLNILTENQGPFSEDMIRDGQKTISAAESRKYKLKKGIKYKEINNDELYVVSQELAQNMLKILHEKFGHIGSRKLWLLFRETFYCKNDLSIAKRITKICDICQKAKEYNFKNQSTPKAIVTTAKHELIAIDFISDLSKSYGNNRHILVILDVFTKYVRLYPCRKTNEKTVERCLTDYANTIGKPQNVIVDNATYFQNNRFKNYCNRNGINIRYTSIRNPKANPAERYIKEVIKFLRIKCHRDHKNWEEEIYDVEVFLNKTHNLTTEETPEMLMFNIKTDRPWLCQNFGQYEEVLEKVNIKMKKRHEKYIKKETRKGRKEVRFNIGDLVLVKALRVPNRRRELCMKLQLPFEGPYMVVQRNGESSYTVANIETGMIRGMFSIDKIFKYYQA